MVGILESTQISLHLLNVLDQRFGLRERIKVHILAIFLVVFIRQNVRNLSTLWLMIQENQGAVPSF